jgi:hypothetical protein
MQYDEMGKIYGAYGDEKNAFSILVGKHEGRRHPGRHRCRWEDNIKIYLNKCDVLTWVVLIWLPLLLLF